MGCFDRPDCGRHLTRAGKTETLGGVKFRLYKTGEYVSTDGQIMIEPENKRFKVFVMGCGYLRWRCRSLDAAARVGIAAFAKLMAAPVNSGDGRKR